MLEKFFHIHFPPHYRSSLEEEDAKRKGYLEDVLIQFADLTQYRVRFFTPFWLQQQTERSLAQNPVSFIKPGTLLIPEVSRKNMIQAIESLWNQGLLMSNLPEKEPRFTINRLVDQRPFQSDRTFQLWKSSVSHGQVLLRSSKGEQHATNIDIYLKGVQYIEVPAYLDGVSIGNPLPHEEKKAKERILDRADLYQGSFVLASQGQLYLVVAPILKITENDFEPHETEMYGI